MKKNRDIEILKENKDIALTIFFVIVALIAISFIQIAHATPIEIPPTAAYAHVKTSNGTVNASNYDSTLNLSGTNGIFVKNSNGYVIISTNLVNGTNGTNGSNGTTITPLTCGTDYQLHSVSSSGIFTCAPNNVTGGGSGITSINSNTNPSQTLQGTSHNVTVTDSGATHTWNLGDWVVMINGAMQTITKALTLNQLTLGGNANGGGNSFINLNHVNSTKLFQGTSQVVDTITPGTNIGVSKSGGTYTVSSTAPAPKVSINGLNASQFTINNFTLNNEYGPRVSLANLTGYVTFNHGSGTITPSFGFKVNTTTCSAGYFVSAYNNSTGIYTCSLGNSGTITGITNIGHGGKGFGAGVSGSNVQIKNLTSTRTDLFTISANTTDVNLSSSFKSNNITCAAGNAVTSFNNSTGTYTCSPFGSLSSAITSVNSQTGPSISVIRQPSYTTITNTTNTVKVGIDATGVMELNGTQTATGAKTFSGGITMSGSDINLANNKLKSNNYNWFETTGFNEVSPGFLLQTSASNQQSMLAIAPSGTGTISGVQLLANSTIGSGTWGTYTNLLSGKYVTEIETGTGSLFPWLVRMGTTSLLSFDTANTITSYVSTLFKAKVTQYNSINTAGIGLVPVYASTLQKSETGSADTNVLTYTPPATAGFYRISVNADVSSATSGVIKFTVSYKDANGNTVTDNPIPIFQSGNATPALSFTTSGAGTYQGSYVININNGATNIVVKWAGGGSSAAKVSTTIEQLA